MSADPRIEHRSALAYLGIAATTSMADEADVIRSSLRRLAEWMVAHGHEPLGAPFVRYRRIEMPDRLDIEVCMPVAAGTRGDGFVHHGEVPAGRYAAKSHFGPAQGLVQANADLQQWAEREGIAFDMVQEGPATVWAARIETSLTDPAAEPDPDRLDTEIAYRLRPPRSAVS